MVELKALSELQDVHLAQAINYLEAYGIVVGLLINFGAKETAIQTSGKYRNEIIHLRHLSIRVICGSDKV